MPDMESIVGKEISVKELWFCHAKELAKLKSELFCIN